MDGIKKLEGAPPPPGVPKGEIGGELPDELDEMKVNLRHFIETVKDGGYFSYEGSLTTPCIKMFYVFLHHN